MSNKDFHKKEKNIDDWINSVRTIKNGDYVTDAFYFLWGSIDDDEIWYKVAEELADILEYVVYKSEYKDEYKELFIEECINK